MECLWECYKILDVKIQSNTYLKNLNESSFCKSCINKNQFFFLFYIESNEDTKTPTGLTFYLRLFNMNFREEKHTTCANIKAGVFQTTTKCWGNQKVSRYVHKSEKWSGKNFQKIMNLHVRYFSRVHVYLALHLY